MVLQLLDDIIRTTVDGRSVVQLTYSELEEVHSKLMLIVGRELENDETFQPFIQKFIQVTISLKYIA